jgi:hypothetical protein
MSEKTLYTLEKLKAMNSSVSWNNKIIIPKSFEKYDYNGKEKKYQIFPTWDNSGSTDGKYWKVFTESFEYNATTKYIHNLAK